MRNKRLEIIKQDLYNQWLILKRLPIIVLFTSSLIGGMVLIVWVLAILLEL